ncbi:HNH endonuclease [Clostridium guangxiense]|uniref:HNH endonuclease n=1 Tax=Clostridium guangxiense TaxID=1662055 RepID=UPI001E57040B|nr:HNH endonuclease signature motif containing protein [Clostridium guangxiense]MCD2348254.1 HNH endonuclease [Clostridium guangxiense]
MNTTKEQIVKYWFKVAGIEERGLSVDAAESYERCWRCGCRAELERCHIIPQFLGGKNYPDNLVLLCHRCHIENPNVKDSEIMWDWIRAYGTPFYDRFWILQAMKEYEFIYNKSFEEELKKRKITDIKSFAGAFKNKFKETSYHFGEPYCNKATIAGMIRMILKDYDAKKVLK